jgi:hypothetical protein
MVLSAGIYVLQFFRKTCRGLTSYLNLLGRGNGIIKILIICKYSRKSL